MKVQIFIVALCVASAYGKPLPEDQAGAEAVSPAAQQSETPKLPEVVASSQAPVADATKAPESVAPVQPVADSEDKKEEVSPKADNPEKEEKIEKVEKKDEEVVADQQSSTQLPQKEEAPVATSTAVAAEQGQSDAANNEVTPGVSGKESKSVDVELPASTNAPSEAPSSSPAADQPAAEVEVKPSEQPQQDQSTQQPQAQASQQDGQQDQPSAQQDQNASEAPQADAVSSTALPETTKANE